jgi:hypothetical protein
MVFQLSRDDVERSSTLTRRDIGKWAMVVCGCIQLLNAKTYAEAMRCYREIMR